MSLYFSNNLVKISAEVDINMIHMELLHHVVAHYSKISSLYVKHANLNNVFITSNRLSPVFSEEILCSLKSKYIDDLLGKSYQEVLLVG